MKLLERLAADPQAMRRALAGVPERERRLVAKQTLRLLDQLGPADRYQALRRYLEALR